MGVQCRSINLAGVVTSSAGSQPDWPENCGRVVMSCTLTGLVCLLLLECTTSLFFELCCLFMFFTFLNRAYLYPSYRQKAWL